MFLSDSPLPQDEWVDLRIEVSYDPFLEQDQMPWEREWRETYRFEPEGMEQ